MVNQAYLNVSNFFTSLNLFCGFLAILLTISQNYSNAVWLLFAAAIFDAIDGRIARAIGRSNEFGIHLDSLSDLVSAGVAPAILIYEFYLRSLGNLGMILAFLPLLFAMYRLARFNVVTLRRGKQRDFAGLPAPMTSICLGSVVLLYQETGWPFLLRFLLVLVPTTCLLMISTIKYDGFPQFSFQQTGGNRVKLAIFIFSLALLPIFPPYVMFGFMMIYIISGPAALVIDHYHKAKQSAPPAQLL